VTIRPVDLVDYVAIAAEVTGMDVATIARLPNLSLAESALHAPFAGFGEHEFRVHCPSAARAGARAEAIVPSPGCARWDLGGSGSAGSRLRTTA
jgi:hypothetical protein